MRITLHEVSKGRNGQALPTMSLEFHTGAVRYALAETEQRPTVLGLIASGRMRSDTGHVHLDGAPNPKQLRHRVALVDAPDVSDPHPDIALAGVVGEELMFAGVGATPLHARRWLARVGFEELASVPIGSIDPAARVRILCELAVLREGVEAIVLVAPDRHGGSPDGWWRIAEEFADRGYAMLVIVGGSAAVALERMHELDAVNASGPIEPLVLSAPEPDPDPAADSGPDPAAHPDAGAGAATEPDANPGPAVDPTTDPVAATDLGPDVATDPDGATGPGPGPGPTANPARTAAPTADPATDSTAPATNEKEDER
ncbi:hypothetical protein [Microbacterium sp. p3-SID336]|uniref:hypothetical protein n=1 Tax=Microbacterium sp. p3-SID336 TaxID=2916212 RepID=UPI0021A65279|nr:hypothetical protein [Microbacterium sp. p3-SID336]MCT1478607.1 hypothetical protein [Microbacterium sp. p3-SID336]